MFRPIRAYLLFSAVASLLAASIHAQKATIAKSAGDYWPLKKGNFWESQLVVPGTASGDVQTLLIKSTVTQVTKEKGGFVASINYTQNGASMQIEKYRVTPTALFRIASGMGGKNIIQPPLPIVKYPLTPGKTWKWAGAIVSGKVSIRATSDFIVAEPEEIVLPAGKFKAIKVHAENTLFLPAQGKNKGQTASLPNDNWFVPGVGWVQQETTLPNGKSVGQMTRFQVTK
jgi:hypothetical protein